MKFKPGDVVEYIHPDAPPEGRGGLAVVKAISGTGVDVDWISLTPYLQGATADGWESRSFRRIGVLNEPTQTIRHAASDSTECAEG